MVVFLSRFIALWRAIAAILAGINGMEWRRFLFFSGIRRRGLGCRIRHGGIWLQGTSRAYLLSTASAYREAYPSESGVRRPATK
jgi:hypothetical protein